MLIQGSKICNSRLCISKSLIQNPPLRDLRRPFEGSSVAPRSKAALSCCTLFARCRAPRRETRRETGAFPTRARARALLPLVLVPLTARAPQLRSLCCPCTVLRDTVVLFKRERERAADIPPLDLSNPIRTRGALRLPPLCFPKGCVRLARGSAVHCAPLRACTACRTHTSRTAHSTRRVRSARLPVLPQPSCPLPPVTCRPRWQACQVLSRARDRSRAGAGRGGASDELEIELELEPELELKPEPVGAGAGVGPLRPDIQSRIPPTPCPASTE